MNKSEHLELKLQQVKLAIAEVNEKRFDNDKQKQLTLDALKKIKESILCKGKRLKIHLEAV